MRTVNIKGKEYVEVSERVKFFRETYPNWSLTTDVVEMNDTYCVLRASIADETGRVVATGMAREVNGDTYINKTSYVENCETSAWGRALGNMAIGIDASIASANEVVNAVNNQQKPNVKQEMDELLDKPKVQSDGMNAGQLEICKQVRLTLLDSDVDVPLTELKSTIADMYKAKRKLLPEKLSPSEVSQLATAVKNKLSA